MPAALSPLVDAWSGESVSTITSAGPASGHDVDLLLQGISQGVEQKVNRLPVVVA